jgi:Fe(3+) dicitrate transport protein
MVFVGSSLVAQIPDSTYLLKEITVTGSRIMNGIGRMNDYSSQIIYAGMKNEILEIDSLDANKVINNTRQIIGRIPGVNITETESGGFTANGISFRGLNPYQSIETNTRQNGYNISADVYGYNEAYYLPPMEAVKSIFFFRDGAALAFGPQFGGTINYELKDGGTKPFEVTSSQTAGSFGLFNSFTSIGGSNGDFKYYGFLQYRRMEGWRVNSQQTQWSGFASIKYHPNDQLQIGIEYTLLRNLIQMPGGLTDSLFNADPKQSLRSRNWLSSPWNILAGHIDYKINEHASISFLSSYLLSERNLIWRNEDGGPAAKDTITPTLSYIPRELEREYFKTFTNELRYLSNYDFLGMNQTFSFGLRAAYSHLIRREGADGATGTDFDLTQVSPWEQDMNFYTTNIAPYIENIFRVSDSFSITPSVRFEYLSTTADGYAPNKADDSNQETVSVHMQRSTRTFVLGALSAQVKTSEEANLYANFSQFYRPITYSDLTPFGSTAKIDQNLKDASAYTIDIGYRGIIGNVLNFDVSIYYMNISNEIGTVEKINNNLTYLFRTNTGGNEHTGIESYVEVNVLNGIFQQHESGKLSIYNSFAYTDARYITGEYTGNQVEYAPHYINRVGLNYSFKGFAVNVQYSFNASSYGDASNIRFSPDGLVGLIPSYSIVDISGSYNIKSSQLRFGVNNLTNAKYFTLRTGEYPGPGIIPSIGRMIYFGISETF